MFTKEDRIILRYLQEGIEISERPYRNIAEQLNLNEEKVLEKIRYFMKEGIIRNFQATLNHQSLGYHSNVMVVWQVPAEKVDFAGKIMASFNEVSHCYEREVDDDWRYNLFIMVHGKNARECIKVIEKISQKTNIKDYEMLFTEEEFKKNYLRYFDDDKP